MQKDAFTNLKNISELSETKKLAKQSWLLHETHANEIYKARICYARNAETRGLTRIAGWTHAREVGTNTVVPSMLTIHERYIHVLHDMQT